MIITLLLLYTLPLIFCIYHGKQTKNAFIAKIGFMPAFNILFAIFCLEDIFTEWVEK